VVNSFSDDTLLTLSSIQQKSRPYAIPHIRLLDLKKIDAAIDSVPFAVSRGMSLMFLSKPHHVLISDNLSCSCSISKEEIVSLYRKYNTARSLTSELSVEMRLCKEFFIEDVVPSSDRRA
jgi:hypothetical protein